ncbi:MAG: NAD(P)/FAD-dependent oxidoreductase [Candidatus Diapherotrites archaeon]|nr:NAD(P)/FAD-dependent oxidoreductase [Candidatus Diapherotrites archaeon]
MTYAPEWDVIIVGGGPAGNKAAQEFAKKKMSVLVIDRKAQIGPPKRCGEGLSTRWIKLGGQEPHPRWALQEITSTMLIAPNGKKIKIDTSKTGQTGYIIERSQWEKMEAGRAIRLGAKYMLKALVTGVIKDGGRVTGVKVSREGNEEEYRCKLLIACDGVDSMVGRYAGLHTAMPLTECDSGYQYEMANVPIDDPKCMELYFGKDVAPRGYVWVFPKGKDVANVGIGIAGTDGETAKSYLDRWLEKHGDRFSKASVTEINAGVIPITKPVDEFVGDGIMLVGDSARMVNPIHGGGMGAALEAAAIAAKVGARAVKAGDTSKKALKPYHDKWNKVRGEEFARILRVRHFVEKLDDEQFNLFVDLVEQKKLDPRLFVELGHGRGLVDIAKILVKASPAAAKFAMSFIK